MRRLVVLRGGQPDFFMSTGQIIIATILIIGLIAFLLDVARNPDRY